MDYTEILKIIKDIIMKMQAWRLILFYLTAVLVVLLFSADKLALLINALK